MSRAFKSSTDCVTDALGTVIGMSITIPSSSGVRNSRAIGVIDDSATRATTTSPRVDPTRPTLRRPVIHAATTAANSVASRRARLPTGAKPTRNVAPRTQARGAGLSSKNERVGR
jgi:hypothetical protein